MEATAANDTQSASYTQNGNARRSLPRVKWTAQNRFAIAFIAVRQSFVNPALAKNKPARRTSEGNGSASRKRHTPSPRYVKAAAVWGKVFEEELQIWEYEGWREVIVSVESQLGERSNPAKSCRWEPTERLSKDEKSAIIEKVVAAEYDVAEGEPDLDIVTEDQLPYNAQDTPLSRVTPFDKAAAQLRKDQANLRAQDRENAMSASTNEPQAEQPKKRKRQPDSDLVQSPDSMVVENMPMDNGAALAGEETVLESQSTGLTPRPSLNASLNVSNLGNTGNDSSASRNARSEDVRSIENHHLPYAAPTGASLDRLAARTFTKLSSNDTLEFFQQLFPALSGVNILRCFLKGDSRKLKSPIDAFAAANEQVTSSVPLAQVLALGNHSRPYRAVDSLAKQIGNSHLFMLHRKYAEYRDGQITLDLGRSLEKRFFLPSMKDKTYVTGGEVVRLTMLDPLSEYSAQVDLQLCHPNHCQVCNPETANRGEEDREKVAVSPIVHTNDLKSMGGDNGRKRFSPGTMGPRPPMPLNFSHKAMVTFWHGIEREVGVCEKKECFVCNGVQNVREELIRQGSNIFMK